MKKTNKNLSLILAPFSVGGPNTAAKDGPSSLMKNGIDKDLIELEYDVNIIKPPKSLLDIHKKLKTKHPKNSIKNISEIYKINKWLSSVVEKEVADKRIPITIGGDHSLAVGTMAGVSAKNEIGVLWIDRHFDAHSPKNTPSWRAHGMPVAVAIGDSKYDTHKDFKKLQSLSSKCPWVKSSNIVQFGIGEKSNISPKTKWLSMEDIDNHGIKKTISKAVNYLSKRVNKIYVGWDIDSMNVTGTGTSGYGQLTLREGLVIAREINKLREKGKIIGFEMMEIAPSLERKDLKGQTVDWAIQLITTSFGGNLFNNLSRLKRNINNVSN